MTPDAILDPWVTTFDGDGVIVETIRPVRTDGVWRVVTSAADDLEVSSRPATDGEGDRFTAQLAGDLPAVWVKPTPEARIAELEIQLAAQTSLVQALIDALGGI